MSGDCERCGDLCECGPPGYRPEEIAIGYYRCALKEIESLRARIEDLRCAAIQAARCQRKDTMRRAIKGAVAESRLYPLVVLPTCDDLSDVIHRVAGEIGVDEPEEGA